MDGLAGVAPDHVLIAVADLDAIGRELDERFGLPSVEGGRHPGWGTANRIVPLGDSYLELVGVVDPAEAGEAPFGRWVGSIARSTPTAFAWCARTSDLDATAERLGLEVQEGSRERPEGTVLRWRIAGLEQAAAEPCLPFFIEWAEGTTFPGSQPVGRLARLDLSGEPERLALWLDGAMPPQVFVQAGEPAITGVIVGLGDAEVAVA